MCHEKCLTGTHRDLIENIGEICSTFEYLRFVISAARSFNVKTLCSFKMLDNVHKNNEFTTTVYKPTRYTKFL